MVWQREDIQKQEFIERLLYSLLAPVVQLGRLTHFSLKDLERLLRIAYFRALKADGLSNREVAEAMNVSTATVARLASETRENFLRPEREHGLPVRIEFMLWAGPMSRAKMLQVLVNEEELEVDGALEEMLAEERIALREDRYELVRPADRLVRPDWVSRIGALNILLENLSEVVQQRFLAERDEPERGFARTLIFKLAREDQEKLRTLYELVLWPALVALDQRAKAREEGDVVDVKLTLFWAIAELLREPPSSGS